MRKQLALLGMTLLAGTMLAGNAHAWGEGRHGRWQGDGPGRYEGYGRGGQMMERYRIIDANDDGRISDDEAAAQRESVFLAMDSDDDGELTQDEFMTVRMGPGEGRNEERRKQREEAKRQRYAAMDADKSGMVSKAEFLAEGKARFDAADADKNGIVTPWEFRAHRD